MKKVEEDANRSLMAAKYLQLKMAVCEQKIETNVS